MAHDRPVLEVETRDGHRYELIRCGPPAAASTMLLVPGMGISARQYIEFGDRMGGHGVRVLIHEWRGNGSSSIRAARDRDWNYRELVEIDLAASLDRACEAADGRVVLAGHSLGAQLAALAAARQPERAAGLALIAGGVPHTALYPLRLKLVLHVMFRAFPLLCAIVGYLPGRTIRFGGREARSVIGDWCRTGLTGRYDLDSLSFDAESALRQLQIPLLAVNMADDAWVPEESLEALVGKMPGCAPSRAMLREADLGGRRADHFTWMRRPEATARVVHDWMAEAT